MLINVKETAVLDDIHFRGLYLDGSLNFVKIKCLKNYENIFIAGQVYDLWVGVVTHHFSSVKKFYVAMPKFLADNEPKQDFCWVIDRDIFTSLEKSRQGLLLTLGEIDYKLIYDFNDYRMLLPKNNFAKAHALELAIAEDIKMGGSPVRNYEMITKIMGDSNDDLFIAIIVTKMVGGKHKSSWIYNCFTDTLCNYKSRSAPIQQRQATICWGKLRIKDEKDFVSIFFH